MVQAGVDQFLGFDDDLSAGAALQDDEIEAKSDDGVQRGVTDLTLEETKVVGSRNAGNGNSSASDTVAPTMATTINVLEPKKKKKKRVQPMLVVNQ